VVKLKCDASYTNSKLYGLIILGSGRCLASLITGMSCTGRRVFRWRARVGSAYGLEDDWGWEERKLDVTYFDLYI
jgi:hypothetical protein